MDKVLKNLIKSELCPNGIWQLSDVMKSILRRQIHRLPKNKVSETEARYPKSPAGMRAFLVKFFTRHYFQTQNSLFDYMISQDFLDTIRFGHLKILDVGSGLAVSSLAITDKFSCILNHLKGLGERPKRNVIKMTCVLNDTSGLCLGTGHHMLADYFRFGRIYDRRIITDRIISIQKAFPANFRQLRRIKCNIGTYDIIVFSYIISPLNEDEGFNGLIDGLLRTRDFCGHNGRILILQGRFQKSLLRRISGAIGTSSYKQELIQCVYPKRNENETYTYAYYCCLYKPFNQMIVKAG